MCMFNHRYHLYNSIRNITIMMTIIVIITIIRKNTTNYLTIIIIIFEEEFVCIDLVYIFEYNILY